MHTDMFHMYIYSENLMKIGPADFGIMVSNKRSSAIVEGPHNARCVSWNLVNCCTAVWKSHL